MANLYFNGTTDTPFHLDPSLEGIISATSEDPIPYTYGTSLDETSTQQTVQFGDGYSQRVQMGINNVNGVYRIEFTKKKKEIALALLRFFRGRSDVHYAQYQMYDRRPNEYFIAKPPHSDDFLKFTCERWNWVPEQHDSVTVRAEFQIVYDPGLV